MVEEIKQLGDMSQKDLCIVTHTFLPHVGGIERVVYEQSKRLLKRHFDLEVLTHKNFTTDQYTYDSIKVRCYGSVNLGFRLGIPYPIPNFTSYKTFSDSVKSSKFIHAHGHPYLSSLAAAKLAKKYSKPFVLTQHNTFIEYGGVWDQVERLNDQFVGRQTLKMAKKIIVISNATKNYVLSLGVPSEKVTLIYNGVDLERFKPIPTVGEVVRKKWGIPKDAKVAITVRRLVFKNGIDTLLESANLALKNNPNLVYLVVGKGPDYSAVKARITQLGIQKNFILAGFVSDQDLPSYYNAADFFILPSKSGEGLPLVGLEAMACGLSLIATDVGGIGEIIINDYGKIVPAHSAEIMAKAAVDFAEMDQSKFKAKLRGIMTEKYSWDRNIDKLVKVYEEII
jgi:glycosyltransferase involved in cell wall biosynthesis